jgi:hypothetical protein
VVWPAACTAEKRVVLSLLIGLWGGSPRATTPPLCFFGLSCTYSCVGIMWGVYVSVDADGWATKNAQISTTYLLFLRCLFCSQKSKTNYYRRIFSYRSVHIYDIYDEGTLPEWDNIYKHK